MTTGVRTASWATALALAIGVVLLAGPAFAFDWADEDCSHWPYGSQHRDCLQAKSDIAATDCSQWTHGETEWRRCQRIHAESEEQKRLQEHPPPVIVDNRRVFIAVP